MKTFKSLIFGAFLLTAIASFGVNAHAGCDSAPDPEPPEDGYTPIRPLSKNKPSSGSIAGGFLDLGKFVKGASMDFKVDPCLGTNINPVEGGDFNTF